MLHKSYLSGLVAGEALALPADAVAAVVAQGRGGVVRPATGVQLALELDVLRVALALAPEEVRSALADSAHVGSVAGALDGVLDVALETEECVKYAGGRREKKEG